MLQVSHYTDSRRRTAQEQITDAKPLRNGAQSVANAELAHTRLASLNKAPLRDVDFSLICDHLAVGARELPTSIDNRVGRVC